MLNFRRLLISFAILSFVVPTFAQQPLSTEMFRNSLHWRGIGPFRGGRTRAVAGVPSQPNVFYTGVCNGGVWRTDDYGRTWTPIFDDQPTGSIGAVAVSESDPNVIYVGSGEGLHRPDLSVGDGIYKSADGGKTWAHLGLREAQQIRQIAIDRVDPDILFVAAVGHPYGPNPERGIFRSEDGGKSFQKVLYKDENVGASDVLIDPTDPNVVYASLWESREGPWENGAWNGPGGGIYKSNDAGKTFEQMTNGLPDGIIQANLAIAPSKPGRLFAMVAIKDKVQLYRTDDGGSSWTAITTDTRPMGRIGGGDLSVPRVDPKNPDVVYVTSTVTWKSTDGGRTWSGFRGAPGGDDYQNIWINPENPRIILLASDQGAIVTVNGGQTWSSWYNQPTAQMYHVSADNAFPYRLCSGQQESGSACIRSRGNDGEITFRDWHPVAAEEYGYVQADPLDPDIVYGGKLTRYDRRTGQGQNIMPKPFRSQEFRVLRTEPVIFSPHDPHLLYFAANTLWATIDGGKSWKQISPDLTRKSYDVPATVGKYRDQETAKPTQRGVIYTVAPSPVDKNRIWTGTDDGQIWLTTDNAAHWTNITPPQVTPFAKVSLIEASHFDANTAYAAINTLRLDDLRPHILRTRDAGKTWTEIVAGIPADENVNAIREDTKRRGMLFAGTERAVHVSFDDGEHWQPLRLNMPASSVRDVIIKDDDLVAATHGRGFWILDDITPLRQFDQKNLGGDAYLFTPQTAYRVRWNTNTDTPLPPDEPAGENPPDGALIDYYVKSAGAGPVTLEIRDSAGKTVRKFSSADQVEKLNPAEIAIPMYWVRQPKGLSNAPGLHRFVWDMHLPPIASIKPEYPIAAIPHDTPPETISPWVMPGQYTVALTANGKSYTQALSIKMDPRVKTPLAGLQQQYTLSKQLFDALIPVANAAAEAEKVKEQVSKLPAGTAQSNAAIGRLNAIVGEGGRRPRGGAPDSLVAMRAALQSLMGAFQEADVAPTTQAAAAVPELVNAAPAFVQKWQTFKQQDLPALNQQLKAANLSDATVSH
jgi:photosystem II stability/assembly factor-like uncharacterized protein